MFGFDASGRLSGMLEAHNGGSQVELVVGVFDQHGRCVATLPNPSTDHAGNLWLWPVVA